MAELYNTVHVPRQVYYVHSTNPKKVNKQLKEIIKKNECDTIEYISKLGEWSNVSNLRQIAVITNFNDTDIPVEDFTPLIQRDIDYITPGLLNNNVYVNDIITPIIKTTRSLLFNPYNTIWFGGTKELNELYINEKNVKKKYEFIEAVEFIKCITF